MKRITLLNFVLVLLLFVSCNKDSINQDELSLEQNPNFKVFDDIIDSSIGRETSYCLESNLIAGQNYIAGTVSAHTDGDLLVITYTTNGDWTIGATHLSIGDCEEQWVPTTGSGNPKVGKIMNLF